MKNRKYVYYQRVGQQKYKSDQTVNANFCDLIVAVCVHLLWTYFSIKKILIPIYYSQGVQFNNSNINNVVALLEL